MTLWRTIPRKGERSKALLGGALRPLFLLSQISSMSSRSFSRGPDDSMDGQVSHLRHRLNVTRFKPVVSSAISFEQPAIDEGTG
jgi:hypothetical protein